MDKESTPETSENPPQQEATGKQPAKPVWIKAGIGLAIIVLVLLAVVAKRTFLAEKVYGRVGDHTIYQAEYDQTVKGSNGVPQDKIVSTLMDKWLYLSIAKEHGISVTEEEINNGYLERGGGKPSSLGENYLKVTVERDLYKSKLQDALKGFYKGRFVTARFDEHLPIAGAPVVRGKPRPSEAQRAQLIANDRAYAEALIKDISQKLKTKQINFDQAMEQQRSDPKLGVKAQPTSPHSGQFTTADTDTYISVILAQPEPQRVLIGLKAGEFSDPFVGKIALGDAKDAPLADGAWLILQVDEVRQKIDGFESFDAMINSYKNKIGYKVTQ